MDNREFYIDCDGMKVHAKLDFPLEETEADRKYPLLILIPGLTGHIEERHIQAVAQGANEVGFACLRAELYGHGKSDGRFCDHTVLLWMSQAMRVIDYARKLVFVSDIYLAGHSQGGLTAVLAAGIMQDKIKGLLPLSPAIIIRDAALTGRMFGYSVDLDHLPEEFPLFGNPEKIVSSNYIRAARILPVEECVREYQGPVLVVHGTEDVDVPYSYSVNLVKKYRNARLVSIEGDTHCYDFHLEQAVDAVKEFLTECEGKNHA